MGFRYGHRWATRTCHRDCNSSRGAGRLRSAQPFMQALYSMVESAARKVEALLLTTPALALRLAKKIAGANLQRLG